MLVCVSCCALCTRDRGCSAHPVFPAPSLFRRGAIDASPGRIAPRECGRMSHRCLTIEWEQHLGPHPEERAFARVSKDGSKHRCCIPPSRRLLRKLLRMRSEIFSTSQLASPRRGIKGFIVEAADLDGAREISAFGGFDNEAHDAAAVGEAH